MSNIQAAMKVADQILSRIFDQRQFTSGEIDFMVREFAHDKVNLDENFQRVLKLNQDACMIADTKLDELCESGETLARNYCDQVSSLQERAENLVNLEAKCREKEARLLRESRAERDKRRRDKYESVQDKLSKLDTTLRAEEAEMERKYRLFEQNLREKK